MSAAPQLDCASKPRLTALVVGPDSKLAATISDLLPDWNIERARDNVAALTLVAAKAFDLVLTGLETSGHADVALLRKLRFVRPHTRLIILTGSSTPADVIASMREHAFCYFSTPISWPALADVMRSVSQSPSWDDGIEVLSATPAWIRIAARCDLTTADRLLQFFHELADLPEPDKSNVGAAFREMLLNAIEHGGRFNPEHYVEISYVHASQVVMCRVKDPGSGFVLDEIRHAATANPPEDPLRHQVYRDAEGLRPGGFGVLLTRSFVDEVIYSEKGNEVLLIKYMRPPGKKSVAGETTTAVN